MPSHCLNQSLAYCWMIRNHFLWHFNKDITIFIEENQFKNVVCKMTAILFRPQSVNSSCPSAAYMCQWIRLVLVQIMAYHYLNQCWVVIRPLRTNFIEILINIPNFSFTKMHPKISSAKWRPFCPGGDVRFLPDVVNGRQVSWEWQLTGQCDSGFQI